MIKILSPLVAFFTVASIFAQGLSSETPKLVIGITIDQLRGDYLEAFKKTFGEKGFKRLLNEGLVYSDVKFAYPNIDRTSAIATIFTGAYPFYHGIVGEKKFSIEEGREISMFADEHYNGIFTSEHLSPSSIKVSTITDELKIATNANADVIAFAPNASEALVSGGHAANNAFWIDDYTAKWASTSFYTAKQPIVDQYNRSSQSLSTVINSFIWRPAKDVSQYTVFPYTQNVYNFQHHFGSDKQKSVKLFKQSPFVNTEIRQMAERVLNNNQLGKRSVPDFLSLTFYAGNYENALDKNYSIEIQDLYFRLDQEIAQLLETVDKTVGINNTLIFVTSTGYFSEQEVLPDNIKLTGGEFRPDRTIAILNMYLMAIYGKEQWIKKYYNGQLYFDHKLIEDRKISLSEFQQRAAEFLVQFEGIQDVITSQQMLHGAYNQTVEFYRNGFYKGISGDLFIEFQPGWKVVDNQVRNDKRINNNAISAPLIFFGQNIAPQKIYRTVDVTEIAPSVAHRLRIRAPNAAKSRVLRELF